ncbi:septal ring lytic transglycosylase RlpA family protein [Hamadaea tsunoensis]|uniref:septal ring lytic transglycosylase RlpA family protein n=1 Tax=Hamadaea tsunoensis TaxID=53368 RepID=UPI00040DA216|nr:septal ring lytic transglycosylase RlpA family protein [Hamadaea tsunoensis]
MTYRARHAYVQRRRPVVAPLATAAALGVAVIGVVGLTQQSAPAQPANTADAGVSTADPVVARRQEIAVQPADRSRPRPSPKPRKAAPSGTCEASYYAEGQGTASGEHFDPRALTAAHKSLKFGTRVRVTNPRNGKWVVVRINDRGPYVSGRCLDLSKAAFASIENPGKGVTTVRYEVI